MNSRPITYTEICGDRQAEFCSYVSMILAHLFNKKKNRNLQGPLDLYMSKEEAVIFADMHSQLTCNIAPLSWNSVGMRDILNAA